MTIVLIFFSRVVFAAVFGTIYIVVIKVRQFSCTSLRAAVGLGVVAVFVLLWVNGAVGIIGDEDNPASLISIGLLAIAPAL